MPKEMQRSTKEFIAGTSGGFVGKLVEFPLDTVKVLLQTQNARNPKYTSALDCIRSVTQKQGPLGLYRGITTPMLGSMVEISALMTTYGYVKRTLGEPGLPSDPVPVWTRVVAGGCAGVTVSLVLTPVELIKCRLQVDSGKYSSAFDCIKQVLKKGGVGGLFRGNASTLMREIPGNIAWFGTYELICDMFRKNKGDETEELSPSCYILAGAGAGMGYWTAFYPADVVKSCIQTGRGIENLPAPRPGTPPRFWDVFRHLAVQEGMGGLYKGWGITVLRAAPSNAAVFFAYEMAMQAMGEGKEHGHPQLDARSAQDVDPHANRLLELRMELRMEHARVHQLELELELHKTKLEHCMHEKGVFSQAAKRALAARETG